MNLLALWIIQQALYYVVFADGSDDLSSIGTVRGACSCKQHPSVIIDLCESTHGTPRVPCMSFLLDGNGRGKPVHILYTRFGALFNELTRVGGKRLGIPSLAL